MAAVGRGEARRPEEARARRHAGNGRGGVETDAQPGSDPGRAANAASSPAFATPSACRAGMAMRLQPNHPTDDAAGIAASILDGLLLRLRRRGDRHQSGDRRFGRHGGSPAAAARRADRAATTFRRKACVLTHVTTTLDADRAGRSGRSGLPVDRGDRGGQPQLRRQSRAACAKRMPPAVSLKRGTRRRQRHVFRDRAGLVRCRPTRITASTSRPSRRAPTRWRAPFRRCWSTRSSASSGRNISTTASRSSAPGSRTISAASCSGCRWVSTSATPTTPRPTRTTWTTC